MSRLLLISNSTASGGAYLEYCQGEIVDFLQGSKRVLFVPWALHDLEGYASKASEAFERIGSTIDSIHNAADFRVAIEGAEALFVGGGNTFRLLDRLHTTGLIEPIRRRVKDGMPYLGASAGSNVACLSIRTTNDMPIIQPPSFDALGLVPFNINPHYIDPDPGSIHMGETREQRIREFHEENDPPVVGLREGSWLRVEGSAMRLGGTRAARLFRRGAEPVEYGSGSDLSFLLGV